MKLVVLAQDAGGGAGMYTQLIFLAVMIAIFYFLLIRPQRKRAKAQQDMAASLQPGQEVRTIGGIHGVVVSIDGDSVVLRVEEGRIRVATRAIAGRVGNETPES